MKLIKIVLILSVFVLILSKALRDNSKNTIDNKESKNRKEDESVKSAETENPDSNKSNTELKTKSSKERTSKREEEEAPKSVENSTSEVKKEQSDSNKTSKERKSKKEEEEAPKSTENSTSEVKKEQSDLNKTSKERKAKREEVDAPNSTSEVKKEQSDPNKASKERKTKREEEDAPKSAEISTSEAKKEQSDPNKTSKERKSNHNNKSLISKNYNSNKKYEKVNVKRKQELINNIPGKTTTFDMGVEAEIIGDPSKIELQQQPENPPKPLKEQEDVPSLEDLNPADKASLEVTGVGKMGPPPRELKLEPVSYVKELSPVGKMQLELQESGDIEYQKLLNSGFETPKVISTLIDNKSTKVVRAANVEYNWNPIDPRNNGLWSNVEFNKYGNRLLDTHRYSTPAKFEKNMFGNVIVHATSDSRLQITTPSSTTLSGFLSVEEGENLVNEDDFMNSLIYDDQ